MSKKINKFDEVVSILADKFDTDNTLNNFSENAELKRCEIEDICEILLEELMCKRLINLNIE